MAINTCLLDFCLNGSKVASAVRPAHYVPSCCGRKERSKRAVQLHHLNRNNVGTVWQPRAPTTKVCVPASGPVQAWSSEYVASMGCNCGVQSVEHVDANQNNTEVNAHHGVEHERVADVDSAENRCNNTNIMNDNTALQDVYYNQTAVQIANAETTLKLRHLKKIKLNKFRESEKNGHSRAGHKNRNGRTFPRQNVLLNKRDTLVGIGDVTRGNVQLPVITQLSEDNTKPAISWAPNKSFLRPTDPTIRTVEEVNQDIPPATSSPVLSRPSQTTATPLSLDVCAVPCVSVPTAKSRRDSTSPERRSTRPRELRDESKLRTTKVFWSEAQTLNQNQLGMSFPGAPPCTPTAELLQHYEYVASMTDIRAQRALRNHLEAIGIVQRRKAEKDRDVQCKREKINQKTQQIETKHMQRSQIYALNKIMTEMEEKMFQEFCKQKADTS